ncbi:plasmid mobilization relaxosome protein MobC, partial [Salmonella enterica subsp. enterica serovar Typhimurium]
MTRQKTHPNLARFIRERVLEVCKASDLQTVTFQ